MLSKYIFVDVKNISILKIILYVVSDKPKILNATSLQLMLNSFRLSKMSFFVIDSKFPDTHTIDSLMKPCSIQSDKLKLKLKTKN